MKKWCVIHEADVDAVLTAGGWRCAGSDHYINGEPCDEFEPIPEDELPRDDADVVSEPDGGR
jgi:hypothetical protein